MSIAIDKTRCVGCGRCVIVCPGSLLKINKKNKAEIKYPKNCWGCCSCLKECSYNALGIYLGADLDGRGSIMNVIKQGNMLYWQVTEASGTVHRIDIDSKEANRY